MRLLLLKILICLVFWQKQIEAQQTYKELYENTPEILNLTNQTESFFLFQVVREYNASFFKNVIIYGFSSFQPAGDLEVYVSSSTFDAKKENTQMKCKKLLDYNPCVFSFSDTISEQDLLPLYLIVKCLSSKCQGTLKIYHIAPIFLDFNKKEEFISTDNQAMIFNFTIPKAENFERLVFLLQNKKELVKTQGTNVVFTKGKPEILRLINGGLLAVFHKNDSNLCFECNVTAFVNCEANVVLELEIFPYNNETKIVSNHDYYDFITGKMTYKYEVSEINSDYCLRFYLKSISGSEKSLYINPDSLPSNESLFLLNNHNENFYYMENDIYICKKDIINNNTGFQVFYLMVSSNITGAFILNIEILGNESKAVIRLDVAENGLIPSNSWKYYEMEVFNTEIEEGKLEVSLINQAGNANLYIRICDSPCQLITNEDVKENKSIDYKSEKLGDDVLVFTPKCPESHSKCYYLLGLKGESSSNITNHFRLLVKRLNSMITLLENIRHDSHIDAQMSQTYKVYILNPLKDIEMISFIVSGDMIYEVTKENDCLKSKENESTIYNKNCSLIGISHHPIIITNETVPMNDFAGIYFIKVVSDEKSQNYMILARVERNNLVKKAHFLKLSEGELFAGTLNKYMPELYFQYSNEYKENVEILVNLQTNNNKFIAYITDTEETPSENNYKWICAQDFQEIYQFSSGKTFYRYNILIRPANFEEISKNESLTFSLMISTNLTLRIINKNSLYLDKISPNETVEFLFYITPNENKLGIMIDPLQPSHLPQGIDVFLGSEPLPDNEYHEIYLNIKEGNNNFITLQHSMLLSLCPLEMRLCKVFMSMFNKESTKVFYSINVYSQEFALELKESCEMKIPLNATGDSLKLFYKVKSKYVPLDISLKNYYPSFDVFVSVYNNKNLDFKTSNISFPNHNSTYILSSKNLKSHILQLPEKSFEDCWPECIILIQVFPNAKVIDSLLWVIIAGESLAITEKNNVFFSLSQENYKYFYYDLSNLLLNKTTASVQFALTHFLGNGGLYFKINDDFYTKRPFPNDFDYFSFEGHMTFFLNELERVRPLQEKMHPKLVVAAFCSSKNCQFSLNVMVSLTKYSQVLLGIPLKVSIQATSNEKKRMYLYKNTLLDGFKAKFIRESGVGKMTVAFCPQLKNFGYKMQDCFNKSNDSSVFFASPGESHLILNKELSNYCEFCDIAILIESLGELKGSLLIIDKHEFSLLQEGNQIMDSLLQGEENRYRLLVAKDRETSIKIKVYSGDPKVFLSKFYEPDKKKFALSLSKGKDSIISITVPAETDKNNKNLEVQKLLYLIISSETVSNYSITYNTGQMIMSLSYGLLESDTLKGNSTKAYQFYTSGGTVTKHLTIMGENSVNALLISFLFKRVDETEFSYYPLNESVGTRNSYTFTIPHDLSGTFRVDLENSQNYNVNFSLIINSLDAIFLPFDFKIQGAMTPEHWKYYEIFSPGEGYLILDLLECLGELYLGYTKNYKNLFLHEWDGYFKLLSKNSYINMLKVSKGMYYFGIRSLDKDHLSFYELTTNFYENFNDIPQSQIIAGNQGILNLHANGKSMDELNYHNVKCEDFCEEEEMKETYLEYKLLIADDIKTLNTRGKCGVKDSKNSNYYLEVSIKNISLLESHKNNDLQNFSLSKVNFEKTDNLFFNLKVNVIGFRNLKNFEIFYSDLEVKEEELKKKTPNLIKSIYFFIGCIGIMLFIALCCCGMHFWKKYLNKEKTLTYEMQDVRNVAQVRGVNDTITINDSIDIDNPTKSYVGLVEE